MPNPKFCLISPLIVMWVLGGGCVRPVDDKPVYQELGNVGASANLLDCSVESAVVESSVEVEPTLKYRIYMAFLLGIGFATLAYLIQTALG